MRSLGRILHGLLCGATSFVNVAIAGEASRSFSIDWSSGDERLKIEIQSAAFRPENREVTRANGITYVDGQKAIGIDGSGPIETEITTFDIRWNGKPVPLPQEAYRNLFNFSVQRASFFPGAMGQLLATRSSKGDALLFVFANGSGSVVQWVWLIVGRDGKWFRFEGGDGESPL